VIDNAQDLLTEARKNGLRFREESVKLNESGVDFLAALVTDEEGVAWVLRTPRRPDVVEAANRESRALAFVRRHLPVAVPEWRIHTPELIAYPRLGGTPIATIDPAAMGYVWSIEKAAIPPAFAESLGTAIGTLHSLDLDEAAAAGLRVSKPHQVREKLRQRIEQVTSRWEVAEAMQQRWAAWLADDSYWPPHSTVIHGDLHAGHILVEPGGRVSGLLDWTEAEVADPGSDLALHYAIFGMPALEAMLQHYEAAGGQIWPRMREHIVEWWAAFPLAVAMLAVQTGKEEDFQAATSALGEQAAAYLADVGPSGLG
jgi:macrolide phosphotransferase